MPYGQEVVVAQRTRVQRQPALLAVHELDADQDVGERLAGAQRAHGRVLVVGDEEPVGVAGAQLVAEHGVEALADHDAPAEDALGGAVGGGDDALVVADDDALLERRDDRGVALLERAAGGFGAAALGDVGADGDRAGDLVVLVEHERDRDADLEQRAVGPAVHGLEVLRRTRARARESAPTTSANFRPTTASLVQPYISSAAGFQLSMRPSASRPMIASETCSTSLAW